MESLQGPHLPAKLGRSLTGLGLLFPKAEHSYLATTPCRSMCMLRPSRTAMPILLLRSTDQCQRLAQRISQPGCWLGPALTWALAGSLLPAAVHGTSCCEALG